MNNLKQEPLDKSRSYASCISAAHKMLFDNIKPIFKHTWMYVAAYSILQSVLYDYYSKALSSDITVMTVIGLWLLALVVLCAEVAYYARVMGIIDNQKMRWNINRCVNLAILFLCFGIIITLLIGALLGVLHLLSQDNTFVGTAANIVLIIVIMALLLPYHYVSIKYLMEPESKMRHLVFKSYKTGLRYWLTIFTTLLLTYLCIAVCAIIISIPMSIVIVVQGLSIYGVNYLADPAGLPSYFVVLQLVVVALTSFIFLYVNMFLVFVCYFMYGNIETREKERIEYLKGKE